MPFDWAGFLQKQILEGKELARLMNMDESSFEEAQLQSGYLEEIARRFANLTRAYLPLLDHDIADLAALREVGAMLYGEEKTGVLSRRALMRE